MEEVNANFYDYLGVPPDAEKKAINKQYRTLAKVILIHLMLTNSNIFELEFRRGILTEIILKMLLKTFGFWQL